MAKKKLTKKRTTGTGPGKRQWTPRPGSKPLRKTESKASDRVDPRTGRPVPDPEVVEKPRSERPDSPFAGRVFHITGMEVWGQDYVNAERQAYVQFEEAGTLGKFHFGYIKGWTDYREVVRDERPAVEWSWAGHDYGGGDDVSGRGWAVLRDDGGLSGRIFLHRGDDSSFEADLATRS